MKIAEFISKQEVKFIHRLQSPDETQCRKFVLNKAEVPQYGFLSL